MIVECSYCESKVDARAIGKHEVLVDDLGSLFCVSLVVCPVCNNALLAEQEASQVGPTRWDWSEATRVWPEPHRGIDWSIPDLVGESLEEAHRCYRARAYSACAVMCGRALEAICRVHETKRGDLFGGLRELHDREIIDKRLLEWSQELRKRRNIGAHATEERISQEDAGDLMDFADAICQYVFVLTAKFEEFMRRSGTGADA